MDFNSKNVTNVTFGELECFKIDNQYCTALISILGAHVLSFIPKATGEDLLFLSEKSFFKPGKAIRGGIPVCWPYFSASKFAGEPGHGFARINDWKVEKIEDCSNGATCISLSISGEKMPDAYAKLNANLTVTFGKTLKLSLTTFNCGNETFELSEAFHTYFKISEISKIKVHGLDGKKFYNKVKNTEEIQTGDITFSAETDTVFVGTSDTCEIHDGAKIISIAKNGSNSTVVWNPWIDKAAKMADFGDDEYHKMVCVETVNAKDDVRQLAPGASHNLTMELSIR